MHSYITRSSHDVERTRQHIQLFAMQRQHFPVHHHIHGLVQIEFHLPYSFSLCQAMFNMSAVVKTRQVAHESQPSNCTPADLFNHPAIYLGFRRNHHCSAGKLAVVESQKKTAPPIEFRFSVGANREWSSSQTRQSKKNRNDVSQFSVAAETPGAQSSHVRRKSHAQQIDVVDHARPVTQAQHIAALNLLRDQRLNGVLHTTIAEIAQERIPRTQR